jgi:DNA-directed RNA polymerase specialized sigma24 family protein
VVVTGEPHEGGVTGEAPAWVTAQALEAALALAHSRPFSGGALLAVTPSEEGAVVRAVALSDALGSLSHCERHVLMWRYYFGFEPAATADMLGLDVATVDLLTRQATAKLTRHQSLARD